MVTRDKKKCPGTFDDVEVQGQAECDGLTEPAGVRRTCDLDAQARSLDFTQVR